ncbi:MAG: zinc-ribbon domain-containing protein [Methanobacterium sp.]|nr:zinc-ribbon domain-containing protein [Methanobacterium sp.]
MVYCDSCGKKNEEDAGYCSQCGNPLKGDNMRRDDHKRRQRNECFGLPHGNIIGPVIIGVILILIGLSSIYGFSFWTYVWPALIVIVGILIIAGAIYSTRR